MDPWIHESATEAAASAANDAVAAEEATAPEVPAAGEESPAPEVSASSAKGTKKKKKKSTLAPKLAFRQGFGQRQSQSRSPGPLRIP